MRLRLDFPGEPKSQETTESSSRASFVKKGEDCTHARDNLVRVGDAQSFEDLRDSRFNRREAGSAFLRNRRVALALCHELKHLHLCAGQPVNPSFFLFVLPNGTPMATQRLIERGEKIDGVVHETFSEVSDSARNQAVVDACTCSVGMFAQKYRHNFWVTDLQNLNKINSAGSFAERDVNNRRIGVKRIHYFFCREGAIAQLRGETMCRQCLIEKVPDERVILDDQYSALERVHGIKFRQFRDGAFRYVVHTPQNLWQN